MGVRRFRVVLAFFAVAVLLAGCGGGGGDNDRAAVEAGLRDYFSTIHPEDSVFPTGAGPPRVRDNSCKYQHQTFPLPPPGSTKPTNGQKTVALWQCSVTFKSFTLPVAVAVNDSNEIDWALPVYGGSQKPPRLDPARTYTG
jgi:hypothetical protein